MYEKFFSLDELPFDGLPDNRFYYVGNYQHQALARHQIPRIHPSADSASAFKLGNHNGMRNVCGLTEIGEPAFRNLVAKMSVVRISRVNHER